MWGIGRALSVGEDKKEPSATVEIDETQIAFVGGGNVGGGTLHDQEIQHWPAPRRQPR